MALKQSDNPDKEIQELNKSRELGERNGDELRQLIASHEEALAWRGKQLNELAHKLDIASRELEAIHSTFGWKLILRVRQIRESLLPFGSSRRGFFEKIMGFVKGKK